METTLNLQEKIKKEASNKLYSNTKNEDSKLCSSNKDDTCGVLFIVSEEGQLNVI